MSCVNIDGKRNVQVAHDGRLLKNMTQRIVPETDDDGRAYILLQSRKDPQEQECRYLKVLVFEHHSSIAGVRRAKLGVEDVELVDDAKGVHISNLRLTESGLDKVENQNGFKAEKKAESDGEDEIKAKGEDDDSSEEAPSHPVPETSAGENTDADDSGEDQDNDSDKSEADKAADGANVAEDEQSAVDEASPERKSAGNGKTEAVVLTAVPTTEGGSHYDLFDADGNSVLDTYNDGKKVNGKKNLNEIAEDYGVNIEFEAKE